jgi:hypothetical protein
MDAEKPGHDNHHDDHADNIKNAHGPAPVELLSSLSNIPTPRSGCSERNTKVRSAAINRDVPLPPAIAVIAAATEQQKHDDDDK